MHVTAGMECRLKVDAANGWVLDGQFNDLANLMVIHTALNCGDKSYVETDGCKAIQRKQLLLKNVRLTANDAVGLTFKAVELEIDRGARFSELFEEPVIMCNALAVGVDHDKRNAARVRSFYEVDDLRMDGGLAAGELHHFRVTFGAHKIVQDRLHFFQGQAEARPRIGKAKWAIHIAGAVDFNDAKTGVLLMIGAQAAIVGTAIFDLRAIGKRDRARFVELAELRVCLRIPIHQRLEGAAVRAALGHVDFVVAQ